MRVNIWVVITILVIHVTSLMATRSVEAALAKQLNKKGYAVLQLKKKRLVLRNTEDNDIKKQDSNESHHHKKSKPLESIPADEALRNKFIDTNVMRKFANTNLSVNNRRRRQKGERDDYLQKAENDDIDSMEKSFKAGANDLAAALEAEETREIADSKNGKFAHETEIKQSMSNAIESDDKYNANRNYEDNDNKQESVISDHWDYDADKDAEKHSGNRESLDSRDKDGNTQKSEEDENTQTSEEDEDSQTSEEDESQTSEKDEKSETSEKKSENVEQLAKDVGTVLKLVTKGEKKLLEEMEEIKSALDKSIKTLQNVEMEMIVKRKRRDAMASKALSEVMTSLSRDDIATLLARSKRENLEGPSRACIFIDAPVTSNVAASVADFHQDQSQSYSNNVVLNSNAGQGEQFGQYQASYNSESGNGYSSGQSQEYSNSIEQQSQSNSRDMQSRVSIDDVNHEHFQTSISSMTNSAEEDNNHQSVYGTQSMGEQSIDLHSIYWLKLPTEYNDSFDEKVYSLLKGVSHTGRDILIIPVTRSYKNSDDMTDGFLRAVQVSPSSRRAQYFKQVRQLNIQRMI